MQTFTSYRCLRLSSVHPVVLRSTRCTPSRLIGHIGSSTTASGEGAAAPERPEPTEQPSVPEAPKRVDRVEQPPPQQEEAPTVDVDATTVTTAIVPAESAASSSEPAGQEQVDTATSPASHPLEDVPEEEEEDIIASKELVREMLDGSAFGRRGEGWTLAQVAAVAMLFFPPLTLKGLVDFLASACLTSGVILIVWAFVNLGRSFNPLPQPRKKHSLVLHGIYSYVRHPMYGGLLLGALALTVLSRNETRLLFTAVLWWILERKASFEEAALAERYPEYGAYRERVKKFIPFVY